jgi:hypothetical protein
MTGLSLGNWENTLAAFHGQLTRTRTPGVPSACLTLKVEARLNTSHENRLLGRRYVGSVEPYWVAREVPPLPAIRTPGLVLEEQVHCVAQHEQRHYPPGVRFRFLVAWGTPQRRPEMSDTS